MSSRAPAVFKPQTYELCGEHLVCTATGQAASLQRSPGAAMPGRSESDKDCGQPSGEASRPASEQAAAVIASAERQAAEICAQADGEAAEIARRAAEEARAGALAALEREIEDRRAEAARQAEAVVAAARMEREIILAAAQRELLVLALEVARRVVAHEVRVSPDVVLAVAGEALAHLPVDASTAQLQVNPEDKELVEERRRELLALAAGLDELTIKADDSVPRGGCTVRTKAGEVDSRLETRIARVGAALLGDPDGPEGDEAK